MCKTENRNKTKNNPSLSRLSLSLGLSLVLALTFFLSPEFANGQVLTPEVMARMQSDVFQTQLPPSQVPPITNPHFISVIEASLSLEHDEPVFVLDFVQPARIYPMRILVWHEVVYDQIPDPANPEGPPIPILITYSPLTASLVAYKANLGNSTIMLRSSASLLYGNSVLADQYSNDMWSQILGACFNGDCAGKVLERIPIIWTKWGLASKLNPDAMVLSRNTGYKRSYGQDPYMSYYRNPNLPGSLPRPFSTRDKILPLKHPILGVVVDDNQAAVDVEAVREAKVINFQVGVTPMVAMYDKSYDTIRIYNSQPDDDRPLIFRFDGGDFRDDRTNSEWNVMGEAIRGRMRDTRLAPVYAYSALWFAWFTYHPATQVITIDSQNSSISAPDAAGAPGAPGIPGASGPGGDQNLIGAP